MIDTNTVSYLVKGKSHAARLHLAGLSGKQRACISAITEAEIRYGLAKKPVSENVQAAIEGFLLKISVLPWGRDEARAYGTLRADLEISGKTLGNLDMLIAAHAIAVRAVLITNDRAFSHAKTLPVVNWATDL